MTFKVQCTLFHKYDPCFTFQVCNAITSILALYQLSKVQIPEKAIAKAQSLGQEPDAFYAFQLLEETGICCVPGSGFGQKPGTYHFR